jgi:hypothetical protein
MASRRRTFRFVTGLVLLGSLVFLEAVPTAAFARKDAEQPETAGAEIRGKVYRSDGKTAVSGAVVSAYILESGQVIPSQPTSGNGEFALTGLPFGYADLYVETSEGMFAGSQVVSLSPGGKLAVSLDLSVLADKPSAWWAGREPKELPGSGKKPIGVAEVHSKVRGREFWKTPGGIATLGAIGGAVLLAIAASGGGESNASPSTP